MALALRIKLVLFVGALALLLPAAAGTSDAAAATLTQLYTFCQSRNCPDGAQPTDRLVMDNAGNLYGTAAGGNETVCYSGSHGITYTCGGVVFELSPNADKTAWTEKVLYVFCAQPICAGGANPSGGLIMDASGNLYGTAANGGAGAACPDRNIGLGCGVVFELSPNADHTAWTEKVLHRFCRQPNCADGANPSGGLIMDASGNLYGTTLAGGAACPGSNITPENNNIICGVVFELSPNRRRTRWTETVLYSFCARPGCTDGREPNGGLIRDAAGDLYGTTRYGGAACPLIGNGGCGVVFELSPNADQTGWSETVLYTFCQQAGCADGSVPNGGLIMDASGNFYGTTPAGGGNGATSCLGTVPTPCGVVFELSPNAAQTGWSETVLHTFCARSGCADGMSPVASLTLDAAGRLYGATEYGGRNTPAQCRQAGGCGTLFVLFPNADGTAWRERVLYRFCALAGCADGKWPHAGPIMDAAGTLYGTTSFGGPRRHGTVFALTRP